MVVISIISSISDSFPSQPNESPIMTMIKWVSAFIVCPLCAFPYFLYAQPWNRHEGLNNTDQGGVGQNQQHPPLTRRQKILVVIVAALSFAIAYYGAGIYYLVHSRDACTNDNGTNGSLDSPFWIFTLLHVCIFTSVSACIRMYNFPYGILFPSMKQNLFQLFLSTVFVIYASVLLLTPRVTCDGEYDSGLYVWMWYVLYV